MSLSLTKMAVLTGYANTISLKEFAKNRLFLVTPAGPIAERRQTVQHNVQDYR